MKRTASYPARRKSAPKKKKTEADQIKALQRKVNAITRAIEDKQAEFYEGVTMGTYSTSPSETYIYTRSLSLIPQGTGDHQRIGDQVVVKGIEFDLRIIVPSTQLAPLLFRICLFKDKQQSNSSSIAAAGPFGAKTSPFEDVGTGIDVAIMQRKWDMKNRYKFYRDVLEEAKSKVILDYDPTTGNTTTLVPPNIVRRFAVKIPPTKVQYTAGGGGNGDVSTNMFQLGVYAVRTGSNLTAPTIQISGRVIFTDA